MIRVYGLRACDACRKSVKWLRERGLESEFIDLRAEPVGHERLERWLAALGEDRLLNRRSATWRGLSEAERARPALALLSAHPTLAKRPVVEWDGAITAGFQPAAWSEL